MGYSYLRLRGLDQTRINITIDGVPLNDPEDQVLYFANLADLMSNAEVQVQRGVGTSTAGTASYAGSINFETMPVARRERSGDVEVQLGSFGAQRASASFNSGLGDNRLAAYGRVSALRTNGYRDHSGVMGRSAFLGAGWFGNRDIVKVTALVGQLADTLSYTGATLAELAQNRRYNPLYPNERDKFGQQMVSLAYTHAGLNGESSSITLYRNSASGNYDYFDLPDRYRYNLAHTWYGLTSAYNVERGVARLSTGVNANIYQRAHRAYYQPDTELYDNTGHKQDVSAFAKASVDVGRSRWFADVQGRWAQFRYDPSAEAGISGRSIDWAFLNPKAGVTLSLRPGLSAFASYGITSREPARSDLFAGEDDLNADNVADFGDFSRVKPERLHDTELGLTHPPVVRSRGQSLQHGFPQRHGRIGAPTASGAIPRRSVRAAIAAGLSSTPPIGASTRWYWPATPRWSDNRIKQFTDSFAWYAGGASGCGADADTEVHRPTAWNCCPPASGVQRGRALSVAGVSRQHEQCRSDAARLLHGRCVGPNDGAGFHAHRAWCEPRRHAEVRQRRRVGVGQGALLRAAGAGGVRDARLFVLAADQSGGFSRVIRG